MRVLTFSNNGEDHCDNPSLSTRPSWPTVRTYYMSAVPMIVRAEAKSTVKATR